MKQEHTTREQEFHRLKQEYTATPVPEEGPAKMQKAINRAMAEKHKVIRLRRFRQAGLTAAAALTLLVITPNVSQNAAMAMSRLPIIGPIVRVVTIRDYQFADEHHDADVSIPKIEAEAADGSSVPAADQLNQNVSAYIDTLVDAFQADMAAHGEGNQSLDVSYETVTDTDTWFTLKLSVLEAQASGSQSLRYYHIDKTTGKTAVLADLFQAGADYKTIISDNIRQQMADQMAKDDSIVYWLDDPEVPEENFQSIRDDQNFYFDKDGHLVISFDEYEVAPGYMGAVEFVIPDHVLEGIR